MAPAAKDDKLLPDRRLADERNGWLTLDINSDVTDLGFPCWDQLNLFGFNSTIPPDESSDVELHRHSSSSDENVGSIETITTSCDSTHSSNYPDEELITDATWAVKQEIDPDSSVDNLLSESPVDELLSESSLDNLLSESSLENFNKFLSSAKDFDLEEFLFPHHTNTIEPSKGDEGDDNVDTKNSNTKLNSKKSKTDVPPEWEQPGPSGTTRPLQDVPEGARGDGRKYRKKPAEKATPSTSQQRRTPIRKSKERSKQLMKLTFDSENDQDQSESKKRKIDTRCSETNCNSNSGSNYDCIHKQEAKSKRIKNNEASKKCRARRREEQLNNELELIHLQRENESLKMELAVLKEDWNDLKRKMWSYFCNKDQ